MSRPFALVSSSVVALLLTHAACSSDPDTPGDGSTTSSSTSSSASSSGSSGSSTSSSSSSGASTSSTSSSGASSSGSSGDGTSSGGTSSGDGGAGVPASAKQVEVGRIHTCALTTAGEVRCWGDNSYGQLGTGGAAGEESRVPVQVKGLATGAKWIGTSVDHACAVTAAGGVQCWGYNGDGQLGTGAKGDPSAVPVDVPGLTGIARVVAGESHTCVLTTGGGVKCWGKNDAGQLGNGSTDPESLSPVDVTGLGSGVTAIAAGRTHTCAIAGGAAKCWGSNLYGEQGIGTAGNGVRTPGVVTGFASGVAAISAGDSTTCLVTTGGAAHCFGKNDSGQLGNAKGGTGEEEHSPVAVSTLTTQTTSIAAGWGFACALVGGGVKCWGSNFDLVIGNGETPSFETNVPVAVSTLATGVASVAASVHRACAITTAGALRCWGTSALGNDATKAVGDQSSAIPVAVVGLP